MADDPRIRASDQDRERTASLLREHYAAGRLDGEEFGERLDQAYQAKTLGDLDALMADLPPIDLYRLPDATGPQTRRVTPGAGSLVEAAARGSIERRARGGRLSPAWGTAWSSWFTVTAICFAIWAATGMGYPWPLWIAGPWGVIMLVRWLTGGRPDGHHPNGPR